MKREEQEKLRVLFLCTGNSCRSQMAEGWLRHLAGNRFDVASAGTHPVGLNQGAVAAMREVGVDIARHASKKVDQFLGERFDYVITVCDSAKEVCPTFPSATSLLHWSFDEPAAAQGTPEERRQGFRRVRDDIADRVRLFLTSATART